MVNDGLKSAGFSAILWRYWRRIKGIVCNTIEVGLIDGCWVGSRLEKLPNEDQNFMIHYEKINQAAADEANNI